jgi:hypothetical protein
MGKKEKQQDKSKDLLVFITHNEGNCTECEEEFGLETGYSLMLASRFACVARGLTIWNIFLRAMPLSLAAPGNTRRYARCC